ncbi:MAG: hypothetical protein HRU09_19510 [Oligoflexales bacterium]|nr:hypothetical protein [Oligoflexales bacterium]
MVLLSRSPMIHLLLSVAFFGFGTACSTEPEYEAIKTVDTENARVNNGEAGNKPRVSTNSSGNNSTGGENNSDLGSNSVGNGNANDSDAEQTSDTDEESSTMDLVFTWDAPAETDISSYKIYSKMGDQAESLVSEVMVSNLNLTVPAIPLP